MDTLLKQFHKVSNALQTTQILLTTCTNLHSSLLQFVCGIRENFDEIEKQAKAVLPDVEHKTLRRKRRVRKPQKNDGRANDAFDDIPPRDKFRIYSFVPVLDALYSNLERRATVYRAGTRNYGAQLEN